MKIVLKNTSIYRDDDLRALVQAACKMTGVNCKKLILTAKMQKKNGRVNGRASCRQGLRHWIRACMLLYTKPPETFDLKRFKMTVIHEAMHLAGATHATMTDEQRYCYGELPAWAEPFELRTKEEEPKEERRAAERADRIEHAQAMHKRALTRLHRAETIEKKWKRRLAAMQRAAERT